MVVVSEFAVDWPYSHPRPTPETNHHYHGMVRAFASEYRLHPLDGFPRAEAQRWGIANPGAVRYVRAMFGDAVSDGLASVNPFAGVRVGPPPRRRRDELVPTELDIRRVLSASTPQMGAVIALGAYVGLRQSEILAARWPSLHMDRLYVDGQMSRRGAVKPAKGKVKQRTVQVFRPALDRLNLWASHSQGAVGFIVGPLTHDQLRTRWDALRAETGLRCEFHQLRTFCATWLLEQGIDPIDVAVQLHGHTDPTVVLSYYAMIDKGKALERLRKVVDGG